MQPYDIFMLIVLVGAAAFGAWKGMAWQLASIASVAVSTIVALRFSGLLAPSLSAEEPWNQFLAMGILFAATSLGVWIAFRFVAKAIDRVKLKEFDRQMGALFGAAKGVLYCLILTFFAVTLSEGTRQRVLDSRSGYYAAVLVEKGTPMMPEKVRTALGEYIRKLDEGLNPGTPPTTPGEQLEEIGSALADGKLPFSPLGEPGTSTEPTTLESWKQGAKDLVNQHSGQFGQQPIQPPVQTTGLESWKQGAQNFADEQANQFGQQVGSAVNQQVDQYGRQVSNAVNQQVDQYGRQIGTAVNNQVDQYGRQIGTAIDQNYTPYRNSVDRSAEQIRSSVQRGFDELGRRIQQAPMAPIR